MGAGAGSGLMAAGSIASSYAQSQAIEAQGDYQRRMAEVSGRMSDFQAQEAIARGQKEAEKYKQKVKGMVGSQRAALAAQGIEIDSGSAAEIQQDTERIAEEDVHTIKSNAWREAWGYRAQAVDARGQGAWAQLAAQASSRNTLIAGGLQAAGYGMQGYADWRKENPKVPKKAGT